MNTKELEDRIETLERLLTKNALAMTQLQSHLSVMAAFFSQLAAREGITQAEFFQIYNLQARTSHHGVLVHYEEVSPSVSAFVDRRPPLSAPTEPPPTLFGPKQS